MTLKVDDQITPIPLQASHAEDLYKLILNNREAGQWLSWIKSTSGPDPAYLAQNAITPRIGKRTTFGIFLKNELVGQIEFHPQDTSATPGTGSLGYFLDSQYTGQGIVTRACKAVISYAFETMKLTGMEIHCRKANTSSIKVALRLGFKGGEPSDRIDGQLLFTMTPQQWQEARS